MAIEFAEKVAAGVVTFIVIQVLIMCSRWFHRLVVKTEHEAAVWYHALHKHPGKMEKCLQGKCAKFAAISVAYSTTVTGVDNSHNQLTHF